MNVKTLKIAKDGVKAKLKRQRPAACWQNELIPSTNKNWFRP